jgi:hypothetical protein
MYGSMTFFVPIKGHVISFIGNISFRVTWIYSCAIVIHIWFRINYFLVSFKAELFLYTEKHTPNQNWSDVLYLFIYKKTLKILWKNKLEYPMQFWRPRRNTGGFQNQFSRFVHRSMKQNRESTRYMWKKYIHPPQ